MSEAFNRALSIVLGFEGNDKITDDPRDPGGMTRFGISQMAHPAVDVRSLTMDLAAEIYRTSYWQPLQCDEMPGPVALCLFDGGVNQGTNTAARMLQSVVSASVDGIIGPRTLVAIHKRPVSRVVRDFMTARAQRYIATGGFATFGRGWLARVVGITVEAIQWAEE